MAGCTCAYPDAKRAAVAGRRWLAEDASGLMPVASRQRFPKALTIELQGVRTISALLLSVDDVVEVPTR